MLLSISHTTTYSYDEPIPYGLMQVRLAPISGALQEVQSWEMSVEGARPQVDYTDHHGNSVQLIAAKPDASTISITVEGDVETHTTNGVSPANRSPAPRWLYKRQTPFTEPGTLIRELAAPAIDSVDSLHRMSARILDLVGYVPGSTTTVTKAEEAVASGAGVCQDHAQIFVSACRLNGVPARYISGYLMLDDSLSADASHAWAEAWVEDLGWVGFDVSNGISPDERYVRIAAGLDYVDVAPITGIRSGVGDESLNVQVQVVQQ